MQKLTTDKLRVWLCLVLLTVSACARDADAVATSIAATFTARPLATDVTAVATVITAPTQEPSLPPATVPVTNLPPPTPVPTTTTQPSGLSRTATPVPGSIVGQHTVQAGESLFCIGRAYRVVPSAIAQASNLSANASLTPGQVLQIPAVLWTEIPEGPICAAQFNSPYAEGGISPSPTPVNDSRGQEAILILEPGVGSSITSPVRVAGQADPTFEQSLVVQISDEAGKVVAAVPAQIASELGQRGPFSVDVPFTVSAQQPGRVSVFSTSAKDGGLIHLASVEVTLLPAGGAATLNPAQPHNETLALFTPALLETISGGAAHITGFSDYVFESQLGVVICGEGGAAEPDPFCGTADNVLATGAAFVNSPDVGQPGPFTADVAYTVTAPVRGRIVVFDSSPRDGGITHLVSQEVTLAP